jgi:putative addiction module component (TIGR02574 family)
MSDFQSLFADASRLPLGERVQLIDALWETLPVEAMPPLSEEWRAEIGRRSDEFDAGSVQPIPWEQVHAESLKRLRDAE